MGGCIHGVVGFCQWCNEDAKERIKKLNLPKIDIRALYPDSLPQQGPIEEEPEQDKCACESCLEEITIDDLVSWADGVMGALGTEYAQRVTDLEIEIAYLILFAVKKNKQNKQNKIRIYGAWYDEEGNIVACFC